MKRIVFALALLITSWSFASLTDGLVGYWPFDGNVKDGSGRGHKLSGSVAYTADRNGNDNSAAVFEGNASLKLPQSLYVARSLTVSVWCKPSGTIPTGLRDMLSQTDGATMVGSQYVLYPSHGGLASTGKAGVGLVVGQNGVIVMEHADGYCPTPLVWYGNIGNNWTLVTVTISGNGAPHLYINGDFIKKGTTSSKTKFVGASDWSLPDEYPEGNEQYRGYYWGSVIGNGVTVDYSHCPYSGLMDDFRIYNRALSASEIKLLYKGEVAQLHAVKFDANNGEGIMEDEIVMAGADLSLPPNKFHNDGFLFQGWALSSAGEVVYKDEASITVNSDMTFYAVWTLLPPPTLLVETADWTHGTITLRCGETGFGVADAPFYTLLYFDTAKNEWLDIDRDDLLIPSPSMETNADGVEVLITKITDRKFARRNNGIGTVRYRVRDENGRVSAECVTRTRYGLFVAIGEYADSRINTLKVPALECALFKIAYMQYGQGTGMCQTLAGKKSTRSGILLELEKMADRVPPGDIFLFYFAGHGGTGYMLCHDYNREKETGKITAEDLYACFGKFCDGVGLISMIACCHSASMFIQDNGSMNLGRVGWILSSQTDEITYDNSIISIICNDGWIDGKADVKNGEYGRGDGDGYVTFWELAIYGYDFTGKNGYYGYRQHMDKANDFILDNIIVGKVPSNGAEVRALKWLAQSAPSYISSSADGDVMKTMAMTAANGCRTVAECYALGINPEDPNDDLRITDFKMVDGKPVIKLNHTKDGSGNSFADRVKTLGKEKLTDAEWKEVPEDGNPGFRFFTIGVDMP